MIISRGNTAIYNIAHNTSCLDKASKLVIALIDAVVQSQLFKGLSTPLSVARYHFKSLTLLVGTVDVINQVSLWTIGDIKSKKAPYYDDLVKEGQVRLNTKTLSKLFLLIGKVGETTIGAANLGLINLGQFSANTLGNITLAKDLIMFAGTVASAALTLPEAQVSLLNYNKNPDQTLEGKRERGAHAKNIAKVNKWKEIQRTLSGEKEEIYLSAVEKIEVVQGKRPAQHFPSGPPSKSSREEKWQEIINEIQADNNTGMAAMVDYKITKWSTKEENLNKDWWKKQIAAINDVAKLIIITTCLTLAAASLLTAVSPWLFITFGLVSSTLGLAKSLYDGDPANQPKKVTPLINNVFA